MSGSSLVARLRESAMRPYADADLKRAAADALERAEAVIEAAKRMKSYAVAGSIAHPDIIRDFDRALAAMGERAEG